MIQCSSSATSISHYRSIFDSALEVYRKKTKSDLASHPLLIKIESCDCPEAVLTTLQSEILGFDQARSSNNKTSTWLNSTVKILYTFSSTIGESVGLKFPPAALVFTGIGILLSAATAVGTNQDILNDLFERIEEFFRRLEVYIGVQPSAEMVEMIVNIMVEVLFILAIATKEVRQSKTKTFLKKLVGRTDIEDALQKLDKLTADEVWMVAAQGLKAIKCVSNNMKVIEDKVTEGGEKTINAIQHMASNFGDLNRNQLRRDLRRWLCPPDPSVNYNVASAAQHKDTAAWFIKGSTFADWKATGSLLWVHGKPGSGKTILSSAIIQDIERTSNAALASMAYFYFDFKDIDKQDPRALLTSLLIQLSDQSDSFCEVLLHLYTVHRDGVQQPSDAALVQSLKKMITTAGTVPIYLIIDALDECPDTSGLQSSREKVLELVEDLLQLRNPTLRLCVTSRPEIDIRTSLEQCSPESSCISLHDQTGQKEDIINYIRSVVYSDKKMKRWRIEDKELVIETLSDRAGGMFRYVSCQLETLRRCLAPRVRQILEELPETLDETYERILQEIPKSNRTHTHRLLQCLAVAFRPLRVEELAEVIAVDFDAEGGIPKLYEDLRWEDQEQAVLSACPSLVSVVEAGGSRVVQFSHFSVKEFLTSERLASKKDTSRYYILLEPAHTIIAQACLGILIGLDHSIDEPGINDFPLARYAADHIGDHVEFGDVLSRIQDGIDHLLDSDKPHFSPWLWLRGILTWGRFPEVGPLYYVAKFGFYRLVKHLISKHPDDVYSGDEYGNPLHAALEEGHEDVSELLLAYLVDVDVQDCMGRTPLHLAAYEGLFVVTRTLIERNADINARSNKGKTPLHESLRGVYDHLNVRYFSVIRLLLEHGAEVDAPDRHLSTPLHLACYEGCVTAALLLLEHGANTNVRNNYGRTPLHEALSRKIGLRTVVSQPTLAELLLEHSADVNTQDNHQWTPLHLASSQGLLDAARVLLEHGASVDLPNEEGMTPVHLAAKHGRPEMIRLLLEHDTDVDAQDDYPLSPKTLAPYIGSPEAVQLALGCYANANIRDYAGQTPLHTALEAMGYGMSDKYCNVVRLLLEHHAKVDARDSNQLTPLQLASRYGNAEGAQLLLKRVASVHVRNGWKTLLHEVMESEFPYWAHHLDFTRLLLVYGADVDAQDDNLSTPLHLASCKGLPKAAKLLLEHGANVHMQNSDGRTPLHCVTQYGHRDLDTMRLLLKHNADVDARDHTQSTPLHLASCEGSLGAVQLLLEHGVDVHVRDEK